MSASERVAARKGSQRARATIPPIGLVLGAVAMLFLGAGAYGLIKPEAVPQLAAPAVTWSLIAVGIVLDAAALFVVLGAARKLRRRQGD